jgi:hypothetical protein
MPPLSRNLAVAMLLASIGIIVSIPAQAATCKDVVTAKSVSRAQFSDKEARAREAALSQWRTRARANYGFAYRFWSRSADRSLECTSTETSATCIAKARPCRVI